MKKKSTRLWQVYLLILSVLIIMSPVSAAFARQQSQEDDAEKKALALLEELSPEERVGQLFLVTFKGREINENTQIYDLVANHHVGGVMLLASNDNYNGPEETTASTYQLIADLQALEWEAAGADFVDPVTKEVVNRNYLPLLIGITQEGGGYPHDQMLNGMTPLPNQMAIGATWEPELAKQVGQVLGTELHLLGFNLLLGPSLDVADTYQAEYGENLGARVFGGSPFWVGMMGQAYISGIHEGSGGQLAVIAKHFPGRGGSDRSPDEQVATVRKSLEQLQQVELPPFYDAAGEAAGPEARADGFLVPHIRYQAFQGNIRATTRPISFDQAALEQVMALEPIAVWRQSGGILVSDDLGSPAVRRFYDPDNRAFDARQVARQAFLAGNDLLYVNDFVSTEDPDTYTTVIRTLEFFTQKYLEDSAFAQRVDSSVARLLTLKFKLYPDFQLGNILSDPDLLTEIGQSRQVASDVAQKSVVLISPDPDELSTILPNPPDSRERVVFITDTQAVRQCTTCMEQFDFPVDGLQNAVLRLYGPQAGNQVLSNRLSSYSFSTLTDLLDSNLTEENTIEDDLVLADWVIFAFRNLDPERPDSAALQRLLAEQPSLLHNKRVIAFAFAEPYYLDATDISSLTAYYGMYSESPAFLEAAARVLFSELTPVSSLPVSIPSTGYDLATALSPAPFQVISLGVDLDMLPVPEAQEPTQELELTVTPTVSPPTFKVGDLIPLKTGVILDRNNHAVPDGTVVQFLFTNSGVDSSSTQQLESTTRDGVAFSAYRIQQSGLLEIRVVSGMAQTSDLLQLNIPEVGGAAVTAIVPLPTNQASATAQLTATLAHTPTPTETPIPVVELPPQPGTSDWLLTMGIIWVAAIIIFWFGQYRVSMRWGVRWGLLAVIGGLAGYLFMVSGIGAAADLVKQWGKIGIAAIIMVGALLGWGAGLVWYVGYKPQQIRPGFSFLARKRKDKAGNGEGH
jgi:beta-N-acetylhexosaminidase